MNFTVLSLTFNFILEKEEGIVTIIFLKMKIKGNKIKISFLQINFKKKILRNIREEGGRPFLTLAYTLGVGDTK